MKDFFIIGFILFIVILGNSITNTILEEDSEKIINVLNYLKENIENKEIAKQKADEVYDLWLGTEEKWSIIVDHQELDMIKTAILTTKAAIKVEDVEEGYEQIENSIFLVGHIKDKIKVDLQNIF